MLVFTARLLADHLTADIHQRDCVEDVLVTLLAVSHTFAETLLNCKASIPMTCRCQP